MTNQITKLNDVQTMSSRDIAELTGKQHKHILDDTRKMLEELNSKTASFSAVYINQQGREMPCFNLPKRECLILVSGYSIKMRAAIIDRWQELEVKQAAKPAELPYHIRRYLANVGNVPKGHFAILPEMCTRLIFPLDKVGYHLTEKMLPDISFGLLFCRHLRDSHGVNTNLLPKYLHKYEDGRVVYPKCYPNKLYAIAIWFLDDVWMPEHADRYFKARDEKSLQYLGKAFRLTC
jgi:hypothetical protein